MASADEHAASDHWPASDAPGTTVLVYAADGLARAGLVALLLAADDLELGGEAADIESLSDLEGAGAELTLLLIEEEADLDAVAEVGGPVLAVVGDETTAGLALEAGALGAVYRNADPERIRMAVRAVARGLAVLEPSLLRAEAGVVPPRPAGDALDEATLIIEPLTPREQQVLRLIAEGMTNREVAARLAVSESTVKFHLNALLGKFGANTRTALVVRAIRAGRLIV